MRVKIFRSSAASTIEEKVNEWLSSLPLEVEIIRTETTATTHEAKPLIVISIWYEGG